MTNEQLIAAALAAYGEVDDRLGKMAAASRTTDKEAGEALLALASVHLTGAIALSKLVNGEKGTAMWLYQKADELAAASSPDPRP